MTTYKLDLREFARWVLEKYKSAPFSWLTPNQIWTTVKLHYLSCVIPIEAIADLMAQPYDAVPRIMDMFDRWLEEEKGIKREELRVPADPMFGDADTLLYIAKGDFVDE